MNDDIKNGGEDDDDETNNNGGSTKKKKKKKAKGAGGQFTSKIAPPSLGGKKVGVFSTRTPHRPNPIGFSLCKLDKIVIHPKKKKGQAKQKGEGTFSLLLSGLDIVDGTPILDIKPYVPHYDCVGYTSPLASMATIKTDASSSSNDEEERPSTTSAEINGPNSVRVPHWVDSGLQKRRNVTFLPAANQFLEDLSSQQNTKQSTSSTSNPSSTTQPSLTQIQFYGPHSPWKDSPNQSVTYLKQCILELLGVDVRSAWQTKKARKGKFQAERSSRLKEWKGSNGNDGSSGNTTNAMAGGSVDALPANDGAKSGGRLCTQQIDNLLVQFTIEEPGSILYNESEIGKSSLVDERSKGSGAQDIVVVHAISLIK